MRVASSAEGQRRLRCRRSGLVVQGVGAASETAESAAEAETADDAGATARRLPPGVERAGREAVTRHSGARPLRREPGIQTMRSFLDSGFVRARARTPRNDGRMLCPDRGDGLSSLPRSPGPAVSALR